MDINGGFVNYKHVSSVAGVPGADMYVYSHWYFFNPPVKERVGSQYEQYVDVGDVRINSILLTKYLMREHPSQYLYYTSSINSLPMIVSVSGNHNFPSTTFTETGKFFPSFSNELQIPDTISKSAGLTFTLSNLKNGNLNAMIVFDFVTSSHDSVLVVNPEQLRDVSPGNSYSMQIIFSNESVRKFSAGGRNYDAHYFYQYMKSGIVLIP